MKNVTFQLCVLLLLLVASAATALATDQEKANLNKMVQQIHVMESVLNQNYDQLRIYLQSRLLDEQTLNRLKALPVISNGGKRPPGSAP